MNNQPTKTLKQTLTTLPNTELKFDKAMQFCLERKEYENINLTTCMKEAKLQEHFNISNTQADFIKIAHFSYARDKELNEINLIDFQQLLSAIASSSIGEKQRRFIYIIESNKDTGISIYFGISKTKDTNENAQFLKDTFDGIYTGSSSSICNEVDKPFKDSMKHSRLMLGIPTLKKHADKSYKQHLEKILFPMQNKTFRICIVAESLSPHITQEIIANLQELGSSVHTLTQSSKNMQESSSYTTGSSHTEGITHTESSSYTTGDSKTTKTNKSKYIGIATGVLQFGATAGLMCAGAAGLAPILAGLGSITGAIGGIGGFALGPLGGVATMTGGAIAGASSGFIAGMVTGGGIGAMAGNALSQTMGKIASNYTNDTQTQSSSTTTSTSKATSSSDTTSQSNTEGKTIGLTYEEINKSAKFCEDMIDKHIQRFQQGLNYGMWQSTLYIQSDDESTLNALQHTLRSVYSGDETFYESIRFTPSFDSEVNNFSVKKLPLISLQEKPNAILHPIHKTFASLSTLISTPELSILTALPNNDITGISVSRSSSFGLTQGKIESFIDIGNILNKRLPTNQRFHLSANAINSHIFVSGITGSGKSNTIKKILTSLPKDIPFLVIEPAKSEYKDLISVIKDLQVFRPGIKGDIFRFNPFVFEHSRSQGGISLTKHVDMLKTSFCSAFPMYGPMPYILEEALHKIYEDRGWSFDTEDNPYFTDSKHADYERRSLLFPTMQDLYAKVESVVAQAGYHDELNSNLRAALKTRIKNLTLGIKGKIFNSRHAFSSEILFEKPTIIELSNITDDEEKSFIMGLLLNKLHQYRETQGDSNNTLKHVCIIEEAHRLLPNIPLHKSSEEANARGKAVETFINILSEIRSFGQGIIIADQIASKLHSDVIKNTNVKIVQRTMDKEDRELIGNAINLTQDQILDIAELKTGEAIVHNKDVHQAFLVKIDNLKIEHKEANLTHFYNQFFGIHPIYQYDYIGEKMFYERIGNISPEKRESSKNKALQILSKHRQLYQKSFLKFINRVWLSETKDIQKDDKIHEGFKNFYNIEEICDCTMFYLVAEIWKSFSKLSHIKHFNTPESYFNIYTSFLKLVLNLMQEDFKKATTIYDDLNYYLQDSSFNNIHKSMYADEDNPTKHTEKHNLIDYTLLIHENIITRNLTKKVEDIWESNETNEVEHKADSIARLLFERTNRELRQCIVAYSGLDIKLGKIN